MTEEGARKKAKETGIKCNYVEQDGPGCFVYEGWAEPCGCSYLQHRSGEVCCEPCSRHKNNNRATLEEI